MFSSLKFGSVSLPILLAALSASHMLPSEPGVMPNGSAPDVGTLNSWTDPDVVTWATLSPANSVAYRVPSGPGARPYGSAPLVGRANGAGTVPAVVMRLTVSVPMLVNHKLRSDPGAIAYGWLMAAGNSVTVPVVVISATWLA